MIDKWPKRFELIRYFAWAGLVGIVLLISAIFTPQEFKRWPLIFGAFFLLPLILYVYVVVIWHWKERYRGRHSDLWGALILIETSGWFKLVYMLRHILPDMQNRGRYRR